VVIRDEPPLATEAPPKGVPLGYGQSDRTGDANRWVMARIHALNEAFHELLKIVVPALGGWRQIVFAIGLACLCDGVGDALSSFRTGVPSTMMFFGGLLIGLALRIPWLKG